VTGRTSLDDQVAADGEGKPMSESVVVHHFEEQKVGVGPVRRDPVVILGQYNDLEDLMLQLTAGEARCFEVHSVCGLHGFVFARSIARFCQERLMVSAETQGSERNQIVSGRSHPAM
jgi:hypothetical protein